MANGIETGGLGTGTGTAGGTMAGLKAEAASLTDQAGDKLKGAAASGKDMAADAVHGLADAARGVADKMTDPKTKPVAEYANKAADSMDRFSDMLKRKSVDEMGTDVRNTIREHPGIAIGAAVAVGFILARFLKASGHRVDHDVYED
jgi:ElaB/YqjD/DUF883 family membrane-anchored ribosome-binding protein